MSRSSPGSSHSCGRQTPAGPERAQLAAGRSDQLSVRSYSTTPSFRTWVENSGFWRSSSTSDTSNSVTGTLLARRNQSPPSSPRSMSESSRNVRYSSKVEPNPMTRCRDGSIAPRLRAISLAARCARRRRADRPSFLAIVRRLRRAAAARTMSSLMLQLYHATRSMGYGRRMPGRFGGRSGRRTGRFELANVSSLQKGQGGRRGSLRG
jgi:hypothetical protein